jgi:hypothetical protein
MVDQAPDEESRVKSIKNAALTAVNEAITIAGEWPQDGTPVVLSGDIVGIHAGLWIAIREDPGQITEGIVHLIHEGNAWRVNSTVRVDNFEHQRGLETSPPCVNWSCSTSFPVLGPTGVAMLWGLADGNAVEVEFGFGFAEPRRRPVERGTGCFLVLQEIDQDQASVFRNLRAMKRNATQPILTLHQENGTQISVGYGDL